MSPLSLNPTLVATMIWYWAQHAPMADPNTPKSPKFVSSSVSHPTIINPFENNQTLVSISVATQAPLKLIDFNFIHSFWVKISPDSQTNLNLVHHLFRKNKAMKLWTLNIPYECTKTNSFSMLVLVLFSHTIILFIATAKTSWEAWTTLATIYWKPSTGRIV